MKALAVIGFLTVAYCAGVMAREQWLWRQIRKANHG